MKSSSSARKDGLLVGDILVSFNKTSVTNHHEIYRLLTKNVIGQSVEIGILRAERFIELTITPTEDATPQENM